MQIIRTTALKIKVVTTSKCLRSVHNIFFSTAEKKQTFQTYDSDKN